MSLQRRLLIILMWIPLIAAGQKRATHWVFGGNGGLDFSCSPPRLELTAFDGLEGGASISDEDGNLLMYTNGDDLFDRTHRAMENGRGLNGLCKEFGTYASASQSSVFIPHPGNPNLYYLFTTDCEEDQFVDGLQYNIIDISLNNGLGAITAKNIPLLSPAAEKVAAVVHANGKDVWVVAHEMGSNRFFAYLVTEAGFNEQAVISSAGQIHRGGRGYLKFSPNGKKLASGSFMSGYNDGEDLEIFSFDDATGKVSPLYTFLNEVNSIYSLSFSPDGTKLYVGCAWTCEGHLVQYDLSAGDFQDIVASKYTFRHSIATTHFGAFQLGPDGRLYFLAENGNGSFFGVLDYPNLPGAASGYRPEVIPLDFCRTRPTWGLPNFIESYFKTKIEGSASCVPNDLSIIRKVDFEVIPTDDCNKIQIIGKSELALELDYGFSRPSWLLNYGDGETEIGANTPNIITHVYANPGTYTITLSIKALCEMPSKQATIEISGINNSFTYEQSCDDLSVRFINTSENSPEDVLWHWQFGDGRAAENSRDAQHQFERASSYTVELTAESATSCDSKVQKLVNVYEPLELDLPDDVLICKGDAYTLTSSENRNGIYLWSNGAETPSATVWEAGDYELTISRNECSVSDKITVSVDDDCFDCTVKIPNVFTPGENDDLNAVFGIHSDCQFENFDLIVYDRYGHFLFETDDPNGWDGHIGGQPAPAGIYYFHMDFARRKINGNLLSETKKGWVSLIR
jgi:gliding motility-associated-like protein